MSSIDWVAHLESAQAAYTSVFHPLPARQREAAAEVFRDWIKRFQDGGQPALETLKNEIADKGSPRRHTAARLIVEIPSVEASTFLLETFMFKAHPQLGGGVLHRIGIASPFPDQSWKALKYLRGRDKCTLLEALLREPTDTGRHFVERLLGGKEHSPGIVGSVIKAISNWNEPELLWQIVQSDPLDQSDYPLWLRKDSHVEAAFYLGLAGEQQAVDFLMSVTDDPEQTLASQAARRLAQLAWPGVIPAVKRLLKSADTWVSGIALNAASTLASPAFGSTLLDLIGQQISELGESGLPPISDEAIRVLARLTGQSLPEEQVKYVFGEPQEIFTEDTRNRALILYRNVLRDLDITCRYHRGELLTLEHLAADLLSRHRGPKNAVYNLRAITGENHEYDPDDDLIANLPAVRAWRERATNPDPLSPGGWTFAGSPLAYPG